MKLSVYTLDQRLWQCGDIYRFCPSCVCSQLRCSNTYIILLEFFLRLLAKMSGFAVAVGQLENPELPLNNPQSQTQKSCPDLHPMQFLSWRSFKSLWVLSSHPWALLPLSPPPNRSEGWQTILGYAWPGNVGSDGGGPEPTSDAAMRPPGSSCMYIYIYVHTYF